MSLSVLPFSESTHPKSCEGYCLALLSASEAHLPVPPVSFVAFSVVQAHARVAWAILSRCGMLPTDALLPGAPALERVRLSGPRGYCFSHPQLPAHETS